MNFNVTYEIGYAIGKTKRVILVKNKSLQSKGLKIADVGIFDTLGFFDYQNSSELITYLNTPPSQKTIETAVDNNLKAPVYL